MKVAEVISKAGPELKERLLAVAAGRDDHNTVDPRRLGKWCGSVEDRILGGLRLRRDGSLRHATLWRVNYVSYASSAAAGPNEATHTPSGASDESVRASPASEHAEFNSPNSPDSHDAAEVEVDIE